MWYPPSLELTNRKEISDRLFLDCQPSGNYETHPGNFQFARHPTRIDAQCGSIRLLGEAPMLMRHRWRVHKACCKSDTNA